MTTAEQLATIDRLRRQPFPGRPGRHGGTVGGPGFHLAELHRSQGFWEDDGTGWLEARDQFAAECEALVLLLSRRWGSPEHIDLGVHLERSAAGEPVPEPLLTLCGCATSVHVWWTGGRWIGIGVGQQARELPFQLVVAVGEGDVVPCPPGGSDG
ncbi:hypothetical protein ACFYYR_15290 [Streptomyces sp. NPDC001922]|uniref:hypothetical protein n=1 Tax=Streptomyces sp. NPDC001922 TaxID=3364624 RepID=UPI00368FCE87